MPGYFTDQSMIRRIHREYIVGLGGARSLLMQAAHPVAFAGFFMSTGALDKPYERLERTAQVVDTVFFGEKADADEATARVRRVHSRMRGTLPEAVGTFPAGTPWAADAPDLLLWILATLADSGALVYQRYISKLSAAELDAYWDDYKVVGSLFGLTPEDMPASWADLEAYMEEMLTGDILHLSPTARDLGIDIVLRPPVPLAVRPLLELANFIIIGLLPPVIRKQYGLGWDPVRGLAVRAGQEYTRRLIVPFVPSMLRTRPARPGSARPPFKTDQPPRSRRPQIQAAPAGA